MYTSKLYLFLSTTTSLGVVEMQTEKKQIQITNPYVPNTKVLLI